MEKVKMNKVVDFWNKITVRYGGNYFFAFPADSLVVWVYFGLYCTMLIFSIGYFFYLIKVLKVPPL